MIEIKFDPTRHGDVAWVKAMLEAQEPAKAENPALPLEPQVQLHAVSGARSTADAVPSTSVPEVPAVSSPAPMQGSVDYDAEGIPWDERIHSGNKTKVQAGTWTRRRNIPDEYFYSIRDELKASHQNGAMPQFGASSAPEPPAPPTAPAPPAPPQPDARAPMPAAYVNPFVALAQRVTAGIKAGTYTQDTLVTLIVSLNNPSVTKLADFMTHHEAIPEMNALLDSLG